MQINLDILPEDASVLQQMLRNDVAAIGQGDAQVKENDELRTLIQKLLRHRFGRRSEQLSPDQLKLAIEDIRLLRGICGCPAPVSSPFPDSIVADFGPMRVFSCDSLVRARDLGTAVAGALSDRIGDIGRGSSWVSGW